MKKKVIAMMLSAALVISGAGISSLPNQTAAENNGSTVVANITSGSGIDTPDVTDAPQETSEATKTPDVTDTPGETKMPESTATTQATTRSAVYTFLFTVKSIAEDNTIDGTAVAKFNIV